MKKTEKLLSFLSLLVLISLLGACGGKEEKTTNESITSPPKSNIEEMIEKEVTEETKIPKNKAVEQEKNSVVDKSKEKTVGLNELIEFKDHAEIIITKIEFTDKVSPTKPENYYNYYENTGDGHTYLHIQGTYKNLEADTVDLSWNSPISLNVKYHYKYNYDGSLRIEELDGSDFEIFEYVKPLSTVTFHYLVIVPDEVESSGEALFLSLETYDQQFKLIIR